MPAIRGRRVVRRDAGRPCPVCGSMSAAMLATQAFEALANSLMDGYDIVACQTCGFVYATGLPSADQFAGYYREMSKYEAESESYVASPEDQMRCDGIAEMVSEHTRSREGPVLDVGCATGTLLAAFKRGGYRDVEGIDPSMACAATAWRAYAITVHQGTAADIGSLPRRYGLVCFSAVLEHLLDPLGALRDAWLITANEGLAFVEVPDAESFSSGATAPFQEFSVEHVNYFSVVSLTNLMGLAGFEPVELRRIRIPWLSGAQAPAIHAVFRKVDAPIQWTRDQASEMAVREYVDRSRAIEVRVRDDIRRLADEGRPVLVWGVGTHTRHLLRTGAFDRLVVAAWIDSDPKYEGAVLRGVPILSPSALAGRSESILVSSGTVHHEIKRQIRDVLRLPNDIVLLYD